MPRYFEIEVTLVLPRRIWRRFLIRKSASFAELHLAIQAAFGWQNYHLFEFRHPGTRQRVIAGLPDDEGGPPAPDAKQVRVADQTANGLLYGATWFEYEYDFGDGWIHEVKVRDELTLPETFKRRLLDGERAAPKEDCGGDGGYERMVSVVEKGIDPWGELELAREWIGDWQPEAFDLEALRATFDQTTAAKKPGRFAVN
jgi:hypothetical protein